jgi:polysaccharide biosynthesis protein PslG
MNRCDRGPVAVRKMRIAGSGHTKLDLMRVSFEIHGTQMRALLETRRCLPNFASLIVLGAMVAMESPAADVLPEQTVPQSLGFNVHLTGPDQQWDQIKEAGVKLIRKDFAWGGIERVQGQYNFAPYDRILASLDPRGHRALFILDYRNRLYPNPETSEEGREAFARWAAASVKHFKGRPVLWEIWNEPNVGFWHGQGKLNSGEFADEYVALVKKTAPAMRAADPDCYILGGSVSCLWRDSFRWIDEAFKQGLLDSADGPIEVRDLYGRGRQAQATGGSVALNLNSSPQYIASNVSP